jgi:preprotein translocase subunit SecY
VITGVFGGGVDTGGPRGDNSLSMSVFETLRLAWADPDLRTRILFVLGMFAVFALGVNVQVPIPGVKPDVLEKVIQGNTYLQMMSIFGGGALRRLSIFSLGLNPYITASIILQIYAQANPAMKEEMKEGGEYARKKQNQRTRLLSIILCVAQALGLIAMLQGQSAGVLNFTPGMKIMITLFWTAGAFFVLWLGELISERGVGNGVSMMIFAGIILALPYTVGLVAQGVRDHSIPLLNALALVLVFLATTWFVTLFTVAQRRIPMQHMRRQQGTRVMGGGTSYLPLSVNMAGVIPIIFAITIAYLPANFASYFPKDSPVGNFLITLTEYTSPSSSGFPMFVGCVFFTVLIFFFTFFYNAIQYNVDDIADNLKRSGSYIPGVRPGKQTSDFLNGVVSRITFVGAAFLAAITLMQFIAPKLVGISRLNVLGGSTLLIMVQVALETMRQVEANIMMKRYNA